jgi:hypothetical protein
MVGMGIVLSDLGLGSLQTLDDAQARTVVTIKSLEERSGGGIPHGPEAGHYRGRASI